MGHGLWVTGYGVSGFNFMVSGLSFMA